MLALAVALALLGNKHRAIRNGFSEQGFDSFQEREADPCPAAPIPMPFQLRFLGRFGVRIGA
jgi:hypothetical protein